MGEVSVKAIMEEIYQNIGERNMSIAELYDGTNYYVRRMEEIKKYDDLVIVGAGHHGKIILKMVLLEKSEMNITLCDNNPNMSNMLVQGYKVCSVQEAVQSHPDAFFAITPDKFETELFRQLFYLGIMPDHMSVFSLGFAGIRCE